MLLNALDATGAHWLLHAAEAGLGLLLVLLLGKELLHELLLIAVSVGLVLLVHAKLVWIVHLSKI